MSNQRPRIVGETIATVIIVENDTAFLSPNAPEYIWQSRNKSLAHRLNLTIPQDGLSPSIPNAFEYLANLAVNEMVAEGKRARVLQITNAPIEDGRVY